MKNQSENLLHIRNFEFWDKSPCELIRLTRLGAKTVFSQLEETLESGEVVGRIVDCSGWKYPVFSRIKY